MIIKKTVITEPGFEGMEAWDIYLKNLNGEIIGLHAVGEPNGEWDVHGLDGSVTRKKGFNAMERWGNNYDDNHKMLGRGSFRVHDDIEKVAKELVEDGWITYEGPTKKE